MLKLRRAATNPTIQLLSEIRPPVRIKKILANPSLLCQLFPMQLAQMTDEQTREYHLKKLYQLSLKSLGQIPQLDEPTKEQNQWVERRMRGSARSRSWQRWFVSTPDIQGPYFTEEQKQKLGLTDKDIVGKGMA